MPGTRSVRTARPVAPRKERPDTKRRRATRRRVPRKEEEKGWPQWVVEGSGGMIRDALQTEPLSTRDLASRLSIKSSSVYRQCRRLEEEGLLASSLTEGSRLLFCVDDREVITAANYERCRAEKHEIRTFLGKKRMWELASRGDDDLALVRRR
jgi:MarR family